MEDTILRTTETVAVVELFIGTRRVCNVGIRNSIQYQLEHLVPLVVLEVTKMESQGGTDGQFYGWIIPVGTITGKGGGGKRSWKSSGAFWWFWQWGRRT